MRPPFTKVLETFALLIGATALVLASAGMAGAAEGREVTQVNEDTDTNDDTPDGVVDDGDNEHPSGQDRSVEHGGSGSQGNAGSDPDDDGRGPDRTNGGADMPDGSGGVDLADQDRNNGCGNDDDFEDDNEGLCGGPDRTTDQPGEVEGDDIDDDSQEDDDIVDDDDIDDDDDILDDDDTDGEVIVDEDEVLGGDAEGEEIPVVEVENEFAVNPDTPGAAPSAPATPGRSLAAPATPTQPAVLAAAGTDAQVLGSQVSRAPGQLARTGDATTDLVPFGLGLVLLGFAVQRSSRRLATAR